VPIRNLISIVLSFASDFGSQALVDRDRNIGSGLILQRSAASYGGNHDHVSSWRGAGVSLATPAATDGCERRRPASQGSKWLGRYAGQTGSKQNLSSLDE